MSTHPDAVLQQLKQGAGTRTVHNLERIHEVCRAIHQAGGKDYSLAAVGRRSKERSGPSADTLCTSAGKPFRALIAAWVSHAGIDSGKASQPRSENDWLRRIPDPADRALIGMLIAERNRLRHEVNLLISKADIVVDRRPAVANVRPVGRDVIELLSPETGLVPTEREALAKVFSEKWIEEHGLKIGLHGSLLNDRGRELFPVGFVPGLRKLLGDGEPNRSGVNVNAV
jgi:hypothetical protein